MPAKIGRRGFGAALHPAAAALYRGEPGASTLEEKGIGRPSTYSPTISTIITRGYVARENKRLIPTELGKIVNDTMCRHFPDIVDITFTAGMEEQLDEVEAGELEWHKVIAGLLRPL